MASVDFLKEVLTLNESMNSLSMHSTVVYSKRGLWS
jgi:hypothetical protein